jgi:hypothetical protein
MGVEIGPGVIIEEGWIIGDSPVLPTIITTEFGDDLVTEFNSFITTE